MKTTFTTWTLRISLLMGLLMLYSQARSQIQIQGLVNENEGCAAWNANGTGPEPPGIGHNGTAYYAATSDYVDAASAYGAHATSVTGAFPNFVQALSSNGFTISQLKLRMGLASQGAQVQGVDWFLFAGSEHYMNFGPITVSFYLNGELMISGQARYMVFHIGPSTLSQFQVESNFFKPANAAMGSSAAVQAVAAAFLQDVGSNELSLNLQTLGTTVPLSGNGRSGSYWNFQGSVTIGLPRLPYQGLAVNHEGFAGWDASGVGPEPKRNGHGDQKYYIASRDYDDIDPDTNAAFARLLTTGWAGFQNFALQLRNQNYLPTQIRLTMGLRGLGRDIEGEDWSFINNIHAVNFYHSVVMATLDGEPVFGFVCDTAKSYNNYSAPGPSVWYGTSAYTLIFDASENSSPAIQAIAASFLRDMESRQVHAEMYRATAAAGVINSNGRIGGFWQVDSAALIFCEGPGTEVLAGNVSGHWTKSGHPYIVSGDITIPDGQSLIIDPGVWVKFTDRIQLDVKGSLQAIGNATHQGSIVFTAVNPELGWGHIIFDSTAITNPTSVFKYCTFEYGSAPPPVPASSPYNCGGAIAIRYFDKVTIDHCLFQYNRALFDGSSLYGNAGAIALWTSSPYISNSIFQENKARCTGAITCYNGSSPDIVNCLFHGNYSIINIGYGGGAIMVTDQSHPKIINNAFFRNHSNYKGGGVEIANASNPKLINNIFWSNTALTGTQICINSSNCNPDLRYNDLQGGISGIGPFGTGSGLVENNIDVYPDFIDTLAWHFQLKAISPCVDAGIPSLSGLNLPSDDLLGNIRVWSTGGGTPRIDIGPYEYNSPPFTGLNDPRPAAGASGLHAYPIPFSTELTLEFHILQAEEVVITLFNELGQIVTAPVHRVCQPGVNNITLNTQTLKPGFYVARLDQGMAFRIVKVLKRMQD